jgi:hypothetical protein
MKRILFSFIGLAVLIGSCKQHDKNVPMYNLPLPPDALAFAFFKPGSYWVYQDSATRHTDSVFVTAISQSTNSICCAEAQSAGYGGTFGHFQCAYQSTYDQAVYENGAERDDLPINDKVTNIWRMKFIQNHLNSSTTLLNIPYTLNTVLQFSTESTADAIVVVTDSSSYTYNSVLLSNVLVITHSHDAFYNQSPTKYFLKKGYGILRKEIPDSNRVWNLIRCNIVQ